MPLNHILVEVVFSQLFRLPNAPHPEIFYGALLTDLCKAQSSAMPPILAQAAELLFQRAKSLSVVCLDR